MKKNDKGGDLKKGIASQQPRNNGTGRFGQDTWHQKKEIRNSTTIRDVVPPPTSGGKKK